MRFPKTRSSPSYAARRKSGAASAFFLLSIGATVPAAAQGNWLTTSWQVTEVGGTMGPGNPAFLTSQLQQSSQWLETLGFTIPNFLPNRDARGVNRYQGFYDAGRTSACGNVAALYDGNSQVLRFGTLLFALDSLTILDPKQLTDGQVTINDGYLLTSVHEVFHGVQYAYQDNWPPEVKWFVESTAEAVRYAWGAKTYGNIDRHQRRTYDLPLHEPFAGAGCSANFDFYRTGHFWYDVGEDIARSSQLPQGHPCGIHQRH
jgi:hypothetical protein